MPKELTQPKAERKGAKIIGKFKKMPAKKQYAAYKENHKPGEDGGKRVTGLQSGVVKYFKALNPEKASKSAPNSRHSISIPT